MNLRKEHSTKWPNSARVTAALVALVLTAGATPVLISPASAADDLPPPPAGPYRSVNQPAQAMPGARHPQRPAPQSPGAGWNETGQAGSMRHQAPRGNSGPSSRAQHPMPQQQGQGNWRQQRANPPQAPQRPDWAQGQQGPTQFGPQYRERMHQPQWGQQPPQRPQFDRRARPEWAQQPPRGPEYERPERPDWAERGESSQHRNMPPHMQRPQWPNRQPAPWQQPPHMSPWGSPERSSGDSQGQGPSGYRGQPYPPGYGQGGYPAPPQWAPNR